MLQLIISSKIYTEKYINKSKQSSFSSEICDFTTMAETIHQLAHKGDMKQLQVRILQNNK
jgi:hypothetical protein